MAAIRYLHGAYNCERVPDRELMQRMGHSTREMMDRYARMSRLTGPKRYNLHLAGQSSTEIVVAERSANSAQNDEDSSKTEVPVWLDERL